MYWFINFFLVGPRRHLEALSEISCVVFFTFLPLVVLNIKNLAPTEEHDFFAQIFGGLSVSVSHGQLFMFSLSLLGTLALLIFKDWHDGRFAPRLPIALLFTGIAIVLVVIFGEDPTLSTLDDPDLILLSYYLYGILVLLYYTMIILNAIPAPDIRDTTRGEAKRVEGEARRRREEA